jgi:hypothetical protein
VSTIVNPGTTPQVYTIEGHTIAAGDRVEGVDLDEVGQAAVDDGRLRVLEEEKRSGARKSTKDKAGDSGSADAELTTSSARRSGDTPS